MESESFGSLNSEFTLALVEVICSFQSQNLSVLPLKGMSCDLAENCEISWLQFKKGKLGLGTPAKFCQVCS